jgi:hypothetical protein
MKKSDVSRAAVIGDSDHERGLEYEVKVLHIIGDRFGGSVRTSKGVSVGDFPLDTEFDIPLIEAYGVKVKRPMPTE